jgi:Uma2 family endonuclease
MTVVRSPGDVAHPFTVADLEGMPDDGRRYELIDGELLVNPITPTSRLRDDHLKKAVYARLGSPSFWLVDPARDKPSLTVFELAGGAYREVACVAGDKAWTAAQPFPVRVVPADLVRRLHP